MARKSLKTTTRKYRKKDPKFRKPWIMEVLVDLPMVREITPEGLVLANLPKGRYEIRIIPHPEPDKRARMLDWIVTDSNGRQIGMAKAFADSIQEKGWIRIFEIGEKA